MYKILIVDDEKGIREGMRYLLNWEDYGVEIVGEASNGLEALSLISVHKPHIIITDIKMPIINGIELIKEIQVRQIETRIIILSGYDDFSYVREAMKYGAENYLLKPIDQEELTNSIREIVE